MNFGVSAVTLTPTSMMGSPVIGSIPICWLMSGLTAVHSFRSGGNFQVDGEARGQLGLAVFHGEIAGSRLRAEVDAGGGRQTVGFHVVRN